MTYAELKELVETMDENYSADYLADKEVVIEYRDREDKYHYFGICDWKFNQCANEKLDCLYIRCDDDTSCLEG